LFFPALVSNCSLLHEEELSAELLSGPSRVSEHLEASGYVTDPLEPS
jgi:hypothetical protein